MTAWVRSSFCAGGDCIEVAGSTLHPGMIWLRRTRNGEHVWDKAVRQAEWDAFVAGVKAGDFDNLQETP